MGEFKVRKCCPACPATCEFCTHLKPITEFCKKKKQTVKIGHLGCDDFRCIEYKPTIHRKNNG